MENTESLSDVILENGESVPPEYTAEEIEQQTTDFLMSFIDTLKDITEEQKIKLKDNVMERARNPDKFKDDMFGARKANAPSPQDLILLVCFVLIILAFFGKIYVISRVQIATQRALLFLIW
jgi:hypothetical protein